MGSPLRILHAAVNMNRGGAETLIMNLYRNMDRSKIQFDFLTCKEGIFDQEIMELGGKIYRIPYITDVGHFQYLKELDHFFSLHRDYHCVHSHMDKMSGLVLRSAKKAGIPVRIAHSHNTKSEGGLAARTYKWLSGIFIPHCATHTVACSTESAKWLFPNQADGTMVLRNGIEIDKFIYSGITAQKIRAELKISQKSLVVGHVGRFSEQKNHAFIVDIFAEIVKHRSESTLILAGDGPLRKDIEKRVKSKNLTEKVRFTGIRSDIPDLLQAFDIFLFPSLFEGLPVSLIEAQGMGIDCMISDVISEEVDVGAGLVHFESLKSPPSNWAERIMEMNHIKKDVRNLVKEKGYDVQSSAKILQNFYIEII